jgi:hypothetical protein
MKQLISIIVLYCTSLAISVPPPSSYNSDRILDAIRIVETGGCSDPSNAVGDNGKAIGAFQIHRAYWQDATEFDKSIGGSYADCKNVEYARKVVMAYLTRYCKVWTDESVARLHNGGCNIMKRQGTRAWHSTTAYWNKVRAALKA